MNDMGATFGLIVTALRAAIFSFWRGEQQVQSMIHTRLGRMARRFAHVFALWKAGTLPPPRPPRPKREHVPRPRPPEPRARGWLRKMMQPQAALAGCQMESTIFADPEFPAFMRDCPQAARILRPFMHMIGWELAPAIRLPARPRKPRPPKPPRFKREKLKPYIPGTTRPPFIYRKA